MRSPPTGRSALTTTPRLAGGRRRRPARPGPVGPPRQRASSTGGARRRRGDRRRPRAEPAVATISTTVRASRRRTARGCSGASSGARDHAGRGQRPRAVRVARAVPGDGRRPRARAGRRAPRRGVHVYLPAEPPRSPKGPQTQVPGSVAPSQQCKVPCKAIAATFRRIAQHPVRASPPGKPMKPPDRRSALTRTRPSAAAPPSSFARPGTRRARIRVRRAVAAARHGHRLRAPVLLADHRREQRTRWRARRSS